MLTYSRLVATPKCSCYLSLCLLFQRSPSTPTQSRPHTPQTPSNYNIHPVNAPVATGIQMVMPTYVVAASPSYVQPPQATSRIRKGNVVLPHPGCRVAVPVVCTILTYSCFSVPVNSHRTPEFHPSNIPVSAVTGQPLLAPSVTLAPSPLGHGTSYPVPAYAHHPQLAAAQHYPHVQVCIVGVTRVCVLLDVRRTFDFIFVLRKLITMMIINRNARVLDS